MSFPIFNIVQKTENTIVSDFFDYIKPTIKDGRESIMELLADNVLALDDDFEIKQIDMIYVFLCFYIFQFCFLHKLSLFSIFFASRKPECFYLSLFSAGLCSA